jgi:hypothetical protein
MVQCVAMAIGGQSRGDERVRGLDWLLDALSLWSRRSVKIWQKKISPQSMELVTSMF